jgi:hypothetical protein
MYYNTGQFSYKIVKYNKLQISAFIYDYVMGFSCSPVPGVVVFRPIYSFLKRMFSEL